MKVYRTGNIIKIKMEAKSDCNIIHGMIADDFYNKEPATRAAAQKLLWYGALYREDLK